MAARLHAAEVLRDRKSASYHIIVPACVASLIGVDGWMRCRLDAVCHAGQASARSQLEGFEAEFHQPRYLVLPRTFARRQKLKVGSRVDITIEERIGSTRWAFWRRSATKTIHPHGTLVIDMGDDELTDTTHAALAKETTRLNALRSRLATEMAAIQAAIDSTPQDEELRRVGTVMNRDLRPMPAPSSKVALFEDALASRRAQNDEEPPPPATPSQVAGRTVGRQAYSLRRAAG
ncbi:MAG TPA: hypothetical protein VJ890_08740 [Vineibacter sp.]|nr:hypothetical protein [Vineibacter sp.]